MADLHNGAVIWDMDGTLVDTAELHFQAWQILCKELGKPFSRADFFRTFGRRNPEIIQQLLGTHYSDHQLAELGERKEILYRNAAQQGVALLPGARRLLETIHEAGWKQAIGSSAPRDNLHLILSLTQTERFFDAIVAMEDTQRGKPDPQVFLTAAEKLGVESPRCLVMEDAIAGVQAAKAAGMKCIAIRFVGHHSDPDLRQAGADLVVATLEAVSLETVRRLLLCPPKQ
jgi:beta-phosphoglucomutase